MNFLGWHYRCTKKLDYFYSLLSLNNSWILSCYCPVYVVSLPFYLFPHAQNIALADSSLEPYNSFQQFLIMITFFFRISNNPNRSVPITKINSFHTFNILSRCIEIIVNFF